MRTLALFMALAFARPVSAEPCPGDANGDHRVTIAELVQAVGASLDGCGANLMPNADFAPPLVPSGEYVEFTDTNFGVVVGIGPRPPVQVPRGWGVAQSTNGGALTDLTVGADGSVRMTWGAVSSIAPNSAVQRNDGLFSEQIPVDAVEYEVSFYGNPSDNWFVVAYEDTTPVTQHRLFPTPDNGDTDGAGRVRYSARWTPGAARAIVGICVSQPGTYELRNVQVRAD